MNVSGGFGVRFKAANRAQLRARSTPVSGAAPEAIWWQFYDTQTYPTTGIVQLNFFTAVNNDRTLSNMQAAGQFPDPQWLTLYDVTLDLLTGPTVVSADPPTAAGELNNHSLILKVARGIWTLSISDKRYGPFSLTLLHGTGGPVGDIFASVLGAGPSAVAQYANNTLSPGWNYAGSLIIPPKTNFAYELQFAPVLVPVSVATPLRVSQHGILSRRVL